MNELLLEHGYLHGKPGAYGLTEKGEQFAQEQDHHRGTGGYAHYNRHWETRTWDEQTGDALRADMAAATQGASIVETVADPDAAQDLATTSHEEPAGEDSYLYMPMAYVDSDDDDEEEAPSWGEIAAQVAIAVAIAAAPHAKPFWDNSVKPVVWDGKVVPAARRLRARLPRRAPDAAAQNEQDAGTQEAGTQDASCQGTAAAPVG